jgi:YgiT-type zinc finger domain-containing protein
MNEPHSSHTPEIVQCKECPAGNMHLRHITYFTWLGEELITVPNFPAWICDMCGRREYDERAISWLTMLLSPSAGKSTHRIKPTRQADLTKRNLSHPLRD